MRGAGANPCAGDLYRTWERERSALVALGRRRKWENRRPQLFWRGKIRGREAVINKERLCQRSGQLRAVAGGFINRARLKEI